MVSNELPAWFSSHPLPLFLSLSLCRDSSFHGHGDLRACACSLLLKLRPQVGDQMWNLQAMDATLAVASRACCSPLANFIQIQVHCLFPVIYLYILFYSMFFTFLFTNLFCFVLFWNCLSF